MNSTDAIPEATWALAEPIEPHGASWAHPDGEAHLPAGLVAQVTEYGDRQPSLMTGRGAPDRERRSAR